jgi:hypothetical protein
MVQFKNSSKLSKIKTCFDNSNAEKREQKLQSDLLYQPNDKIILKLKHLDLDTVIKVYYDILSVQSLRGLLLKYAENFQSSNLNLS